MTAPTKTRTQVGILGAGPAGLMLAQLLRLEGVESVVLETQTRAHVEQRNRASVLEQGTADLLNATGTGERMRREGLVHNGVELLFGRKRHRFDLRDLTGGRAITVYAQHEVVKDLIKARIEAGAELLFEVSDVRLAGIDGDSPSIQFCRAGEACELTCDYIAGCDGFHGVSRPSIPTGKLHFYEHEYPFGWLGILAEAPPASHELIYVNSERGFALLSMRSPTISRMYLQCRPDEDTSQWADERIWAELRRRFETSDGFQLNEGSILSKGVTAMRSFVTEPMQYGRLFLAGDAAHIVPPTGAKGMNLAIADVRVLAEALVCRYRTNSDKFLQRYSDICLNRVWLTQHFSWWMTSLLHRSDDGDDFTYRRQLAELDQLTRSTPAAATLAENYTGLPFDHSGAQA